jgi:diguanylate cyclase (GGDEF)-like protein
MDQLTGAADTGELMALEMQLELQARSPDKVRNYGLVLVDLDGLREINSRFGRSTGNGILVELATRLRGLSPDACVARVDASKFAVLADDFSQDRITMEGHRLKYELNAAPWQIGGISIPVHMRVTSVSGPSPDPEETHLLWTAQRIHRAKARWELKERVRDLEALLKLNEVRADVGSFRAELAISLSERDPLTGALNRRGFEQLLPSLATPFALAFVDLDKLRDLNKSQGNWEAGDRALKGLKGLLENISPTGVVARWGGDEFLLCLPQFEATNAHSALSSLLGHPALQLRIGDPPVTFSGGIAVVSSMHDYPSAMERAQERARAAKSAGRSLFLMAE